MIKLYIAAIILFVLTITTHANVSAMDNPLNVVGLENTEIVARLLLAGDMPAAVSARISGQEASLEVHDPIYLGVNIRTLFLVDVSTNMHYNARTQILEILGYLIENKHPDELFSIVTFGDEYRQIVDFTHDRYDLYRVRNQIEWHDYASNVDNALGEAVSHMLGDPTFQFNQIILFSSAETSVGGGITHGEILLLLGGSHVVVHTVGLQLDNDDATIFDFHAFSRVSGGISHDIFPADYDYYNILEAVAQSFRDYSNNIYYIHVEYPEALMDGAIRPLEIFNNAGALILSYDVNVPVLEAPPLPEPTPEPSPIAIPSPTQEIEPVVEPDTGFPLWLILVALLLIVGGAGLIVAIFVTKKKKQVPPQPNNATMIIDTPVIDENATMILIGGNSAKAPGSKNYLIVNDINQPHKRFELLIKDKIIIGREAGQDGISIDYDPQISRKHCSFSSHGGRIWVDDLGSANGTYINNTKLTIPVMIMPDEVLTIGETSFFVSTEVR